MLVILIEKKGNVLGEVYYLVFNFFVQILNYNF